MNKSVFCILFFLCHSILLQAQTLIRGTVTGSNGEPASFAQVSIHTGGDSALLKTTRADTSGRFEFSDMKAGVYLLKVSMLGFHPHSSTLSVYAGNPITDAGMIRLREEEKNLNEVTVRAERAAIRQTALATILQINGNNLFKTSVNVMDILRKAPGISIGPDGALLVSNRNVPALFINGRHVPMSPEESLAYLNGLLPEMIEKIEIISNPPAQYDGQFKAIIDIRLRRDQSLGWKGSVSSSLRRHFYYSADNSLQLSYKTSKTAYHFRTGYVKGDDYYLYTALQQLANTNFMATHTLTRTNNNNLSLEAGADFAISSKQDLSVTFRRYRANRRADSRNTLTFYDPGHINITGRQQTSNLYDPVQANEALNIYYQFRLSEKQRFSILATVSHTGNRRNEDIIIRNAETMQQNSYWKTALKNDAHTRSIQADHTLQLGNGHLETGARFAYIRTINDLQYDTLNNQQVFVHDAFRTNDFNYREYISAVYAAYTYQQNRFDLRVGLRAEHTKTHAGSSAQHDLFERNYLNWLPAISGGYRINNGQRISLAFSQRITRPGFDQLNPFRFYFSPLNYWVGNPYLRPSVTASAQLLYTNKAFSASVTAGREKDLMTRYPEYNRITNELLYLGTNLPYSDFATLEARYSFSVAKWWKISQTAAMNYQKQQMPYLGKTYAIAVADFTLNGSQVFSLPAGITADLTYRYRSNSGNSLYYIRSNGSLDAGIQKAWFNGSLNTVLNAYDLFYTNTARLIFRETEIINNRLNHFNATRRMVFTVAYRFGKSNYKRTERKISDEERRAGN
ncbi:outer membrane beta-barrel protein [Sediminibacterium ginsengisoli]|uniref:Outer membrane receptor proteins, mostly Fe transport n=1 Tax=Sediminibacterium ginsengisoli TaxID=413434 RepID=A0A1T4M004_9BACT|nr:outer membrane beta-barrel protein [Sediminibacterium ginsengisoli]SJZ60231.1 Outer membrane receptor proteins, mostly Fe transport [Sediminibacterium ginsengisoli]